MDSAQNLVKGGKRRNAVLYGVKTIDFVDETSRYQDRNLVELTFYCSSFVMPRSMYLEAVVQ